MTPPAIAAFDAAAGDAAGCAALWQRCGLTRPWNDPERDIARKLAQDPGSFFVVREDGRVVATAMVGWDGHRGWLSHLAVDPALQRRGLGRALVRHAETWLVARGCPKLNLQVRRGNDAALAFYRRLGFAVDDVESLGKRLISDTADPQPHA